MENALYKYLFIIIIYYFQIIFIKPFFWIFPTQVILIKTIFPPQVILIKTISFFHLQNQLDMI